MVAIDLHQAFPTDVSTGEGEKAARVDLSKVIDEHEAFSIVHPKRSPADGVPV